MDFPMRFRSSAMPIHRRGAAARPDNRKGAILPFVAVTELSICLLLFAGLGLAIAFLPGAENGFAGATASLDQPIRRLTLIGGANRLAVLSDHSCFLHDAVSTGGETLWLRHDDVRVTAVGGQPTQPLLALGWSNGDIAAMDTTTTEVVWERDAKEGSISSAALSPDGSFLAVGTVRGTVLLIEASTGTERHRREVGGDVRVLGFTPDGKRLVVPRDDGGVSILDPTTGAETCHSPVHAGRHIAAMALSPDSSRIALGTDYGDVAVIELESGREIARRDLSIVPILSVVFSSEGDRLAVGTVDCPIEILAADDLSGVGKLLGHRRGTRSLVMTDSGLLSGGHDGRVVAWNLSTGQGRDVLIP